MRNAESVTLATTISLLLGSIVPVAFAAPDRGDKFGTAVATLLTIADDDLFSTADLIALLDPPVGTATQHYGPYPSSSPDSGTCGNLWATDTFDRHFTVFSRPDGIVVVQQFKRGSFETDLGPSPGACATSPPGSTVNDGIIGSTHGYFIIPLPPGTMQSSTDSSCVAGNPSAPCTTTGFINTHFTPCYPATCPVTTFFFNYAAGDQGLIQNRWKNASTDRGGNGGDIRST